MNIKRTEDEINNLLNQCSDAEEEGVSKYPGMKYEDGIKAAIEWLLGYIEDHPLNEQIKIHKPETLSIMFVQKENSMIRLKKTADGIKAFIISKEAWDLEQDPEGWDAGVVSAKNIYNQYGDKIQMWNPQSEVPENVDKNWERSFLEGFLSVVKALKEQFVSV